jgi:hypothetical protein
MIQFANTAARIAHYSRQMQKAMPEINRQIEVYKKAVESGNPAPPLGYSYPKCLNLFC